MGDWAAVLEPGGITTVIGVLVIVIGYLLNSNRVDRREYQEAIDRAEKRADAETVRRKAAEQGEQEARKRASTAEDDAAKLAREVHGLQAKVARLDGEVAQLRRTVDGAT